MQLNIRTLPAMRLAAVPHRGPYQDINRAFRRLGEIAGPAGLMGRAAGHMLGIYKDDPRTIAPESLRSAAALPVSTSEPLPPGLVEERLDGGRYACVLHVGPYDGLPAAWRDAVAALAAGGHTRRAGPGLEIYLNDPTSTSPDQLRTEIAIPIE